MNAQESNSNTTEESPDFKISMTSEEYYNRDRTFEYKVVFWCVLGIIIVLLTTF